MAHKKDNPLLKKIGEILKEEPKGKVLDLGCGGGDFSKKAKDLGFNVVSCDISKKGFAYHQEIGFVQADLNRELPFADDDFDFVFFFEVIEHLRSPYFILSEINRILKKEGILFISTPNIMNLRSRIRFLFEGTFEFFREPPLEQSVNPRETAKNVHILPLRFQDLEYLLIMAGFTIEDIFTSRYEGKELSFLLPIIRLQSFLKEKRSLKKKGIDYSRINKILLSKELLYGRHLGIKARKKFYADR